MEPSTTQETVQQVQEGITGVGLHLHGAVIGQFKPGILVPDLDSAMAACGFVKDVILMFYTVVGHSIPQEALACVLQ